MKNKIYHTTQPACRLRMIVGLLLFVAAGMSAASTPILVIDSLNKKLPQLKGEERLAAMEAIYKAMSTCNLRFWTNGRLRPIVRATLSLRQKPA